MVTSPASLHAIGRQTATLAGIAAGSDQAFGSERIDEQRLEDWKFEHCSFVNISFRASTLQKGTFLNCIFDSCYFRQSTLKDSTFTGCRFLDCNFNGIKIHSSRFKYSSFHGCQIPFTEMEHSFPTEPNLKEALAKNLFLASQGLGMSSEAREYRLASLRAREEHLIAAIEGKSDYYKTHFDYIDRVRCGWSLLASWVNRIVWRYGESVWQLLAVTVFLTGLIFPLAYWLAQNGLSSTGNIGLTASDLVYFSIETAFPTPIDSGIIATGHVARLLALVESLLGYVFIALVASYVFRRSLHR